MDAEGRLAEHTLELKSNLRRQRGGTLDHMLSKISRTGVSVKTSTSKALSSGVSQRVAGEGKRGREEWIPLLQNSRLAHSLRLGFARLRVGRRSDTRHGCLQLRFGASFQPAVLQQVSAQGPGLKLGSPRSSSLWSLSLTPRLSSASRAASILHDVVCSLQQTVC